MSSPVGDAEKIKRKEVSGCAQPALPTEKPVEITIALPNGCELNEVAGVELPLEDIGNALQFFEFCNTFGEILKLTEGQPESVLHEITLGRSRRGKISSLTQLHISLLRVIRMDKGEKSVLPPNIDENCWLLALKKLVTQPKLAAVDLAALSFDRTERYGMLSPSEKLKLLVFLCDETLNTELLRNWMNEQNQKFSANIKEAKQQLAAAKKKEKLHKSKLLDEHVKAIMARNGAPLTIAERKKLSSEAKAESERVHAEVMKAMDLIPKNKQTPDAFRTDPVYIDAKGHTYWRLKGYSKPGLLRQDFQGIGEEKSTDEWFYFEGEEKQAIDKYIISVPRVKRRYCSRKSAPKNENEIQNPKTDEIPDSVDDGDNDAQMSKTRDTGDEEMNDEDAQEIESAGSG